MMTELELVLANIHFNSVAGKNTFLQKYGVVNNIFIFPTLVIFIRCVIMDNKTLFSWKSWQMC